MRHYTEGEVLKFLREKVSRSNQKDVAQSLGFTPQYLNDVLGERRPITAQLAESMGYHEIPRRFTRKPLAEAKGFAQ